MLVVLKDFRCCGPRAILAGKTIAVNGLLTNSHVATMAWIDKNGGDSKASKYVEFVYSEMLAALNDNRVDAALFIEPVLTLAKKTGRVFALAYGAIAPHWYTGLYVANANWLANNAATAKRFVEAMTEASEWANRNHRESLQIVARWLKMDPQALSGMTRAVYGTHLDPRKSSRSSTSASSTARSRNHSRRAISSGRPESL